MGTSTTAWSWRLLRGNLASSESLRAARAGRSGDLKLVVAPANVVATEVGRNVEARPGLTRPEPNRWSADKVANIKVMPWSARERRETKVHLEQPSGEVEKLTQAAKPGAPRTFRISSRDLALDGYTGSCAQR